jgi:hypothetical protein
MLVAGVMSYCARLNTAASFVGLRDNVVAVPPASMSSRRTLARTFAASALARVVSSGNEFVSGAVRKIGAGNLAAVVESLLLSQGASTANASLVTELLKARSACAAAGDELVTTTLLARLRGPQLSQVDVGSVMDIARRAAAAEATVGASFILSLLQFGSDCRRARDMESCYAALSVLDGVLASSKRGSWKGLSRETLSAVVTKSFGLVAELPLAMAGLPLRSALSVLRRVIELVPKGSVPIHLALVDHGGFDSFIVSAGSCADVYSVAFVLDTLVCVCDSARACGDAKALTRLQNLALECVAAAVSRPLFALGFLRASFIDGISHIPRECVSAVIEIVRRPASALAVSDSASVWYAALSMLVESADVRDVSRQLCVDLDGSGRVALSQLLLSVVFSPAPATAQVAHVVLRLVTELLGLGSHPDVLAEAELTQANGCVLEVLAAALPDAVAELHGKAAVLSSDADGMAHFDAPRIDLVAAIAKVSMCSISGVVTLLPMTRMFVRSCCSAAPRIKFGSRTRRGSAQSSRSALALQQASCIVSAIKRKRCCSCARFRGRCGRLAGLICCVMLSVLSGILCSVIAQASATVPACAARFCRPWRAPMSAEPVPVVACCCGSHWTTPTRQMCTLHASRSERPRQLWRERRARRPRAAATQLRFSARLPF